MCERLRALGVVACLVGTVLFMAGGLTDHWVDSDNGHFGLWEICDDSKHNASVNATDNATTTGTTEMPRFGHGLGIRTTTMKIKEKDKKRDKKNKEDEDEADSCMPFSITSIPAFFHIVRAIVVLAGLVLAWGVLSGRSLHFKVPRGDTFFETHQSEILGCIGCCGTILALILFTDNYKSVHEDTFTNSHLSWSIYIIRGSLYVYFPAAILMMSPSLCEKYQGFDLSKLCVQKPSRRTTRRANSVSERNNNLEIVSSGSIRRRSLDIDTRDSNRTAVGDDSYSRMAEIEGGLTLDNSFQLSETDSDIFTVTIGNDGGVGGVNYLPPSSNDLPQYEDVARSGDEGSSALPPPPSYEDVLVGGYLTFSPSAPSAPPPLQSISTSGTESSSESTVTSSSTLPPPPAYQYQYNDSNV